MFHSLKSQRTLDNSTLTLNKFDTINKNLLYVSNRVDLIVRILKKFENEDKLQAQVDDFYKTSPQTDTEDQ